LNADKAGVKNLIKEVEVIIYKLHSNIYAIGDVVRGAVSA
jgi:pyruvate/2-oxoglutarate dehydrogenase complex dihydrolipoamide dehydrogenase (E3) component